MVLLLCHLLIPFMDHSLVTVRGLTYLSEAMSHCYGQVTVKSSDKVWSTGEENGNLLHYSCLENLMDCMKRQKGMMPEDSCLIQWL